MNSEQLTGNNESSKIESSDSLENRTDATAIPADAIKGVVKWFNDAKGFGFIEHTNGQDVFVHYSVIQTSGFKTLKDGEEVTYVLGKGTKGLHAQSVHRSPEAIKEQAAERAKANQLKREQEKAAAESGMSATNQNSASTPGLASQIEKTIINDETSSSGAEISPSERQQDIADTQ